MDNFKWAVDVINNPGEYGERVRKLPSITPSLNSLEKEGFSFEKINKDGSTVYYRDVENVQNIPHGETEEDCLYSGWVPGYDCERIVVLSVS